MGYKIMCMIKKEKNISYAYKFADGNIGLSEDDLAMIEEVERQLNETNSQTWT